MNTAETAIHVTDHQFCVLYDASGKIVSVYETIILDGSAPPHRPKDVESRAREASAKLIEAATGKRVDTRKLKVLMTGPDAFAGPGPHRVDVKKLSIVPDKE